MLREQVTLARRHHGRGAAPARRPQGAGRLHHRDGGRGRTVAPARVRQWLSPSAGRVDETNWRTYRDVRLASLLDTPSAFGSTYAAESTFTDERWLARVRSRSSTWLASGVTCRWGRRHRSGSPSRGRTRRASSACGSPGHARRSRGGRRPGRPGAPRRTVRGLARVTLDVAEQNGRARTFYERMGFRPTGRPECCPTTPPSPSSRWPAFCELSELPDGCPHDGWVAVRELVA